MCAMEAYISSKECTVLIRKEEGQKKKAKSDIMKIKQIEHSYISGQKKHHLN